MKCDQCEMLSINGHACHERGCPNDGSRWDADSETWVRVRVCPECGNTVDADAQCCADTDDDAYTEDDRNEEDDSL